MSNASLHNKLKIQIDTFLSEQLLESLPEISDFIQEVNQTYLNHEKVAKSSKKTSQLTKKELIESNAKLKEELDRKVIFQSKLIEAIQQLNSAEKSINQEDNLEDLLEILHKEI